MKMKAMIGGLLVGAAVKAAFAATVTLAPADGVTTNVLQFFAGDTAVEIAGPGTVSLNPANAHTGGTTLSGGTLLLNGTFDGVFSPVGVGAFTVAGGTLSGSGTFPRNITGTGAATIEASDGWAWTGDNAFSAAMTVTNGTLEIAGGNTVFNGGLAVADGATVSVTGGTLGISAASGAGTGTIAIDGGIIQNVYIDPGGNNNWFDCLQSTVGVSIGAEGAVFKGGTTAFYAQISTALSSSVEAGETAAGVTFDGGNWGFYARMAYEGPTVIRNGATLFLANSGYLPSTTAVTVGKDSQLRNGGTGKSIASLTLEDGAIIGYYNKKFTVTGSVTLPSSAKVALYSNNTPKTSARTADGTCEVLSVPAAYADALRAVRWSCANASSDKSYTFSVSADSTNAKLSVTIGAITGTIGNVEGSDSSLVVSAGEYIYRDDKRAIYVGSGSITMNGGFVESPTKNLLSYGTTGAGTVTLDGGLLDVKNVRLCSSPGVRTDLYLNEGGTLRAREMEVASANTVEHAFHFNGGTLKPVAYDTDENYEYFPRYQSAYVGEKGVIVDLSDWAIDGRTDWYRFSCMASFDHDPACSTDGGITVRGTQDGKALFYFGGTFSGSTLNGGVTVEAGGKISAEEQALAGVSVTLLPGSIYKAYSKSYSVAIQSLTAGSENGTEPVALQTGTFASGPALVVEELSVLSPVEFSTAGYKTGEAVWNNEAAANPGVYTALVYRTASPALDPSLFRLPAEYAGDYSLSAATVSLTEGDYAGYTALVFDIAEVVHDNLTLTNNDVVTISSAADYGNIYVGDFEIVGEPVLTLADGADVRAKDFHLAYQPADGANASAGIHTVSYVQNGGALTVDAIYSMFLGEDVAGGRANAGFTLNGGSLDVLGDVMLGYNQTRAGYTTTFTVNDGTMTVGGELLLTRYNSSSSTAPQGILMMNGGALSVMKDIDLSCGKNSSSLYAVDGGVFLRGGVLSARNIKQSSASCTVQRLVFDGGVFAPNAAAAGCTLSGLAKAHVSTNGAIVSTEKLPADGTYTIAQNLLHDPALEGAADGGFKKRGTGTLTLTGANTFTGPTRVEGGTLAISRADTISEDVTVADGAALDLGGTSVTLGRVAASGVIENGSLAVTGSVVTAGDSFLNVGGDLTLVSGVVVDFAGGNAGWRPLAAVSGTVTVPAMLKARNAGGFNRCKTSVIDGVVYGCPTTVGLVLSVK